VECYRAEIENCVRIAMRAQNIHSWRPTSALNCHRVSPFTAGSPFAADLRVPPPAHNPGPYNLTGSATPLFYERRDPKSLSRLVLGIARFSWRKALPFPDTVRAAVLAEISTS
jgi:hypothetical protein